MATRAPQLPMRRGLQMAEGGVCRACASRACDFEIPVVSEQADGYERVVSPHERLKTPRSLVIPERYCTKRQVASFAVGHGTGAAFPSPR